jgi:hypothetical protein
MWYGALSDSDRPYGLKRYLRLQDLGPTDMLAVTSHNTEVFKITALGSLPVTRYDLATRNYFSVPACHQFQLRNVDRRGGMLPSNQYLFLFYYLQRSIN